jgi:7-cyano-7-deazaguanine synthase
VVRALVLLSGGKDSGIALWWSRQEFDSIVSLSIDHPTRPRGEARAARALAELAGSELIETSLPFILPVREITREAKEAFVTRSAYVPMRNLLFYATAGYYAEVNEVDVIVGGHLKSDGDAYSDALPEFFSAIEKLYGQVLDRSFASTRRSLRIALPLIDLSDAEAIALGRRLGAPLEATWSCLEDGPEHCGKCVSCLDRLRALGSL